MLEMVHYLTFVVRYSTAVAHNAAAVVCYVTTVMRYATAVLLDGSSVARYGGAVG